MRGLIAFVSCLVLIAGALLLAPLVIDPADYREDIEAIATEGAGQPVQINGGLSFRILPSPRLVANNILIAPLPHLSELPPPLTAEQVEIDLSFNDLLAGRFQAESMTLIRPVFTWHEDEAGRRNNTATSAPLVNALHVEEGTLHFRDARRERQFSVLNLSGTYALEGTFGARQGAFDGAIEGRASRLAFRLTAADRPAVSAELAVDGVGTVAMTGRVMPGDAWRVQGEASINVPDVGALPALRNHVGLAEALPLRLKGALELTADRVGLDNLSGEIGAVPLGARVTLVDAEIPRIDAALSFEQVAGTQLIRPGQKLANALIAGTISAEAARAVETRLLLDVGLVQFSGGFVRQFSVNAVSRNGQIAVERLAMLMPGGSDFAYSGTVRLGGGAFRLDGDVELASDNLAALLATFGVPVETEGHGRLRNLGLSSRVLVDSTVAQFSDIAMGIDQSRVTGGIAVALLRRPSFSLNLAVDQLNANAYASLMGGVDDPLRALFLDGDTPAAPWLDMFDTNTRLSVGRLIAGKSVARSIVLDAGQVGGVLTMNSLSVGDLDGGSLELSGQVDTPDNPQWLMQGALQTENPGRFAGGWLAERLPWITRFADLRGTFALEGGPVRSALDVSARSRVASGTVSGLVSNLFGETSFDLDVGAEAAELTAAQRVLLPVLSLPSPLPGAMAVTGRISGQPGDMKLEGRIDLLGARAEVAGTVKRREPPSTGSWTYDLRTRFRHGDALTLFRSLVPDYDPLAVEDLPLDIAGAVAGDETAMTIADLRLSAGTNGASGKAVIDWSTPEAGLQLTLRDVSLDLDAFNSRKRHGAAAAASARNRAFRWSREALDIPLPARDRVRVDVGFDRLRWQGLSLTNGQMALQTEPRGWAIKGLRADLADGTVEGGVRLAVRPTPRLAVNLDMRDVRVAPILGPWLGAGHNVDGRLTMRIGATGEGITAYDMMAAAEGRISVDPASAVSWPGDGKVSKLSGELTISNGVLGRGSALSGLGSDGMPARLVGRAELADWRADIEVRNSNGTSTVGLSGPLYDLRMR